MVIAARRLSRCRIRVFTAAILLIGISACAPPTTNTETDALASIADFNRQYLEAINTSDIDALAALTTDDHMMIASGGTPLTGKQALVDAMAGAFDRLTFSESWAPEETVVSGDLAFQRGTFVVLATPKAGGEASETVGNFLRIYRRQGDGRWLMVRDSFIADQ